MCYARCSIPPKIKYAIGSYTLYLAFSLFKYLMMTPAGLYEHRGSLAEDLFLCQYYAGTLWTMVVAYSFKELYSYELEDEDDRGRPAKGMKRDDLQLKANGKRQKVWYRSQKIGAQENEGIMHVFSKNVFVPGAKGESLEQDAIQDLSEGGNLTAYM